MIHLNDTTFYDPSGAITHKQKKWMERGLFVIHTTVFTTAAPYNFYTVSKVEKPQEAIATFYCMEDVEAYLASLDGVAQ